MKLKILLGLALVLSGGLCGCFSSACAAEFATNAEPRYLDKSLSEWIPLTRSVGGDVIHPADGRAAAAVRSIGTNALPWLLQWIRSEKPETARLGVEGFGLLGPIAEPAVPELIRLVNDWTSSSVWSNAIPALAAVRDSNGWPYALAFLQSAATNTTNPAEFRLRALQSLAVVCDSNGWPYALALLHTVATNTTNPAGFRLQVLQSMVDVRWRANEVVFLLCLQDKDWRLAAKAAEGLGDYCIEPLAAVPALAACLATHTNLQAGSTARYVDDLKGDVVVRVNAVRALCAFYGVYHLRSKHSPSVEPAEPAELDQIREAMRPAVPVLVKALSDEDWRVAMWAAEALGAARLEPSLAVPALIKCLDHPQRDVQRAAATALGNFGEAARSAVSALTKIAQADPHGSVGFYVENALEKIVPQTKP